MLTKSILVMDEEDVGFESEVETELSDDQELRFAESRGRYRNPCS